VIVVLLENDWLHAVLVDWKFCAVVLLLLEVGLLFHAVMVLHAITFLLER